MGLTEPRPVVLDDEIVIRRQAPLFVRTDHRMVNAFEAAAFIITLREHLADPWLLIDRGIRYHSGEQPPGVAVDENGHQNSVPKQNDYDSVAQSVERR